MSSNPYPAVHGWGVGPAAVGATLEAVAPTAARGVEGGVFWLGHRAERSVVDTVVVPTGPGVVEHAYFWQVSPEVFGRIGSWAALRGKSLLAIVHTHFESAPPRLSEQDRQHLVRVPDMLAVVIGGGGRDADPATWGWYVWADRGYRWLDDSERGSRIDLNTSRAIDVVVADATGCPSPR